MENMIEARRYAWDYFSLHADQRMKMFNFFLIFSGIILAAFPALLRLAPKNLYVALFPLILPVTSFLFWRLDQRTRHLIHNAEATLKDIEEALAKKSEDGPNFYLLFKRDERALEEVRKKWWSKMGVPITYRESFRLVFLLFAAVGIALSVAVIAR